MTFFFRGDNIYTSKKRGDNQNERESKVCTDFRGHDGDCLRRSCLFGGVSGKHDKVKKDGLYSPSFFIPVFSNIKTRCFLYRIEMEFFAKMGLQKIRHPALKKKWAAFKARMVCIEF